MKIEYMSIEDAIPYERNAKEHPQDQVDYIANSIREFGFRIPILVDENNVVVSGHGRLMAAKQLGLKRVPYIRLSDLSPEQIKAFRLADNKVSESTWDIKMLEMELTTTSFDMEVFGFTIDSYSYEESPLELEDGDDEQTLADDGKEYHCPKCGFVFKA